jgi:hypothetical protein
MALPFFPLFYIFLFSHFSYPPLRLFSVLFEFIDKKKGTTQVKERKRIREEKKGKMKQKKKAERKRKNGERKKEKRGSKTGKINAK